MVCKSQSQVFLSGYMVGALSGFHTTEGLQHVYKVLYKGLPGGTERFRAVLGSLSLFGLRV